MRGQASDDLGHQDVANSSKWTGLGLRKHLSSFLSLQGSAILFELVCFIQMTCRLGLPLFNDQSFQEVHCFALA